MLTEDLGGTGPLFHLVPTLPLDAPTASSNEVKKTLRH